jgi:hypothetical protein
MSEEVRAKSAPGPVDATLTVANGAEPEGRRGGDGHPIFAI